MKTFYEIKTYDSSDFDGMKMISDVDLKSRTVTGYFSRFGNIDHDKDMVMPGAFTKSIKERGIEGKNLIPHVLDHDAHVVLKTLAKPKLYEKADGGFFESTISDTINGIDTLKLYRDGVIDRHSFGYKTLRKEDKANYTELKEILLFEISTVTIPANDEAVFTGFKSMAKPVLIERYNILQKAFKNGDYSDDIFPIIEAQIKQLEQNMLELFIQEQAQKSTISQTTAPVELSATQPEGKDLELRDFITTVKSITDGRRQQTSLIT